MRIKTRLARLLRDFGDQTLTACFDLAERIDPILPKETEMERGARIDVMLATVQLRLDHPCLKCGGEGYVAVSAGSDTAVCPVCKGSRIDPLHLASGVR